MFNNTLYTISQNKGEYIIVPVTIQEESSPSTPSESGKNKKFLFF